MRAWPYGRIPSRVLKRRVGRGAGKMKFRIYFYSRKREREPKELSFFGAEHASSSIAAFS